MTLEQFLEFCQDELDCQGLTAQTEFRALPTWSSLNALLFIARINEEYHVLVSAADLLNSSSLGDIYHLVANRSHGTSSVSS
jgi:acyl carrier protein